MKVFKIDYKSYLRHLWIVIFIIVAIPFIGEFLLRVKLNDYGMGERMFLYSMMSITFVVPALVLHINHYLKNKNVLLFYKVEEELFIYQVNKKKIVIKFSDIEKISVYKTFNLALGRTPSLPWDFYSYSEIQMKKGDLFVISSLLIFELDKMIEFDRIEIKKNFYPWIK